MSKRYQTNSKTAGTSPGTLTYTGDVVGIPSKVTLIEYNEQFERETTVKNMVECLAARPEEQVIWLNVDGIHETAVIEDIGKHYELHSLLLEDVLNTLQKPKFEYFDNDVLFVTLKHLEYNPFSRTVEVEHLSFALGDGWLISFQEERQRDIFEEVRNRIRASIGKTRRNGADYLLYCLLDTVVDNYFLVIEKLSEQLEELEESVISNAQSKHLNALYSLKREMTLVRKWVYPLRELLMSLIRDESELVSPKTHVYLRDVLDHTIQVIESIDSYRELIASLLDLYLSSVSNKMNSVMKVLTVFSAIFMPLTFIVGVYGMNFEFMPELHWEHGYSMVWGLMIAVSVGLLLYFKKRGFL